MMVYYVYSLESPRLGDSNEYTHKIQFNDKQEKFPEISLNIAFLRNRKNRPGTQKQVRIGYGKQSSVFMPLVIVRKFL